MPTRKAAAVWTGNLMEGRGYLELGSGAFKGEYSFASRFESGKGTNPEELIGAAHAGCFSMAFANELATAGFHPEYINTTAKVTLDKTDNGFGITEIELDTVGWGADIDEATFRKYGEGAKVGCPVSKALAATPITLKMKLLTSEEYKALANIQQ